MCSSWGKGEVTRFCIEAFTSGLALLAWHDENLAFSIFQSGAKLQLFRRNWSFESLPGLLE